MDKAINIVLCYCLGDPLSTFDMDIFEGKVSAAVSRFRVALCMRLTWWDNPSQQGYILRLNAVRFPPGMLYCVDRIPCDECSVM